MITRRAPALGLALIALALMFGSGPALAADTQVVVAANFTEPAKEIAQAFKAATGHTAILTFGSSGQIYAQMAHGAPYKVFLSADADRPKKAEQDGLGVPGTRFTYAIGRLVLYSKTPGLVDDRGEVLKTATFNKLSIADPTAAPYGVAAIQTLKAVRAYDAVRPKIVQGSSITQAYQFVQTGAAEIGFVALSQVIRETGGSRWLVPTITRLSISRRSCFTPATRIRRRGPSWPFSRRRPRPRSSRLTATRCDKA